MDTEQLRQEHIADKHRTRLVDGCPICEENLKALDVDLVAERLNRSC